METVSGVKPRALGHKLVDFFVEPDIRRTIVKRSVILLRCIQHDAMELRAGEIGIIKEGVNNPKVSGKFRPGNFAPFHFPVWKIRHSLSQNATRRVMRNGRRDHDSTQKEVPALRLATFINVNV